MTPRMAAAVALSLPLVLGGCGSLPSDYGPYFQIVRQTFSQSLFHSSVTLQQAAAIPYASMGWRLNNGSQNLIVLATDGPDGQLWTSSAHIVLLTENGRIKRTVGLPHDMSALTPRGTTSLTPPSAALHAAYQDQRVADFPDIASFNVAITCHGAPSGLRSILILGKKMTVARVDERCEARALDWRFTNTFWIDRESGMVWRSVQHIHPRGDTLDTEIFRPAG